MTWLSLEHGKMKTAARGALRAGGRFAGMLDLFFECEISYAPSAKSDVHTLRESALRESRENLRRDYPRVALAAYFTELMEIATEPEHPVPELYDLLSRALHHLDEKPASLRALLHFEKELARLLGIAHPSQSPISAIGHACHHIPSSRPSLLKLLPQ